MVTFGMLDWKYPESLTFGIPKSNPMHDYALNAAAAISLIPAAACAHVNYAPAASWPDPNVAAAPAAACKAQGTACALHHKVLMRR